MIAFFDTIEFTDLYLPGADELYDLQADPYEMTNLIAHSRAPLDEMKARLTSLAPN